MVLPVLKLKQATKVLTHEQINPIIYFDQGWDMPQLTALMLKM